ncbi:MAG: DSD1 family PLP-dependent enzyme [Chloroflexota bacterium]
MNTTETVIGMDVHELDTPALLVNLPIMESNLKRMTEYLNGTGVNLRPHVKLHKATPQLAQRQLEAGAIGMTCAKLSEAETLAAAGIHDILIANQIVGSRKIDRLMELARHCDVKVAVDNPINILELAQAAQAAGVRLGVLIEVNIGHNRCGVAPYGPTLELAQLILNQPGLSFLGLMGYDGHCTLKVTESEREALSLKANTLLADTRRYLEDAGVPISIVSAAGTFTYRFAASVDGITEVQAGSYLLMDTAFRDHGIHEFEPALSVLSTVTSRPVYPGAGGLAIIDAGQKSVSTALGDPGVKQPEGLQVRSLSDEHGRILAVDAEARPPLGAKIELEVRDANGTIKQFDRFYVIRDGIVEDVWPIPLCGNST